MDCGGGGEHCRVVNHSGVDCVMTRDEHLNNVMEQLSSARRRVEALSW